MEGIFITFEGIEGCGKSTQAELLMKYLQSEGFDVVLSREPGGTPIAERIRDVLLDNTHKEMLAKTEILLYSASRSQHTGEKLIPALKKGKIVISDRYYDSTLAYQGAARQLDSNAVKFLCSFASSDLVPDITFLIDVPAEVGLSRINVEKADRLEQEALEFHQRVRQGFLDLANKHKRIVIINGQNSIEKINGLIMEIVKKKIKERRK